MIGARLAASLALALLLSLACNVWQYGRERATRARLAERDTAAQVIARAEGRASALGEAWQRAATVADAAAMDRQQLLDELAAIAERARERVVIYRDRIAHLPPPTCAPGAERMQAVNALLEAAP